MFKWPGESIRNRSDVLPGIDFRGDGGYIVAPPSNHVGGNRYEWAKGRGRQDLAPVDMPNWLLEIIRRPPTPKSESAHEGNGDKSELLQAAGRYADKASTATSGARNNAAFAKVTHQNRALFSVTLDDYTFDVTIQLVWLQSWRMFSYAARSGEKCY